MSNHKYYENIINLCSYIKYYNYDENFISNIINNLIKSADIILKTYLNYSNCLLLCYNNLQEIKNKCIFIFRKLVNLNRNINNVSSNIITFKIHINNIDDCINNINNLINEIYKEYYSLNIRINKLLKVLNEINNLNDKLNINVYLKYNIMLNLLYIPDNSLIIILKSIIQKYNQSLLLYSQNKDLILDYQNKLFKDKVIDKMILDNNYLNTNINFLQFNI